MFIKIQKSFKMKNHLPFDQHLKHQLEDVESFVPDNMFEKIMAERNKKSGVALFFQNNSLKFGLAACAVLAATGLLFLKSNQKTVHQPIALVTVPNNEVQTIVASTPQLASMDAPQNQTSYPSKALKTNVLDKAVMAQTTKISVATPIVKSIDVAPSVGQGASQPNIIAQSIDLIKNQSVVPLNPSNVQSIDLIKNQSVISVTPFNPVENQGVAPSNQAENQHTESIDKPKAKSPIAQLPTKKVHLVQGQVKASDVKSIARMMGPEINCPNFNLRKPIRWYIDIWGSPDYAFRKLYNNQEENTPYAKTRDSVEHSWYAFSAGARASLVLESGVAIRAGLNYLQNNEIFDYKKPGEVRTITTTESVKQPDGTIVTNTRIEKQYGTYQLKKYNRYRSLDLPIQLGYEFGSMPWSFSVNGGINFNLTSWRKAEILNPALVPWDASKNEVNVFKSNVGASLYGSFAAYYDWKDYTQLFVEPYIRHFLSPITTKDYTVEQRYTDVGLKLGIRWRL
ncbi:MAG: hypothetical protein RIS64_247 [Bacteroidota bacterium]